MKLTYIVIAACLMLHVSCKRHKPDTAVNQSFVMDSLYQKDKQVTVVKENEHAVLAEEMKNFEDNPNISQADLDAIKHVETKNIKYVQKGDRIVLSEKE